MIIATTWDNRVYVSTDEAKSFQEIAVRWALRRQGRSEPRVDRLGLQGQHREDHLVHPPQRLPVDEPGQRVEPEAVLAEREAALLAEVAGAQDVEDSR